MTSLIVGALDVTLILLLAMLALWLLRHQSAAFKHCALAIALMVAAALPVIKPVLPALQVRLPVAAVLPEFTSTDRVANAVSPATVVAPSQPVETPRRTPWVLAMVATVWATGAVVAGALLLAGFARLRSLTRAARRVSDPRWLAHLDAVRASLGLDRPVMLLESPDSRVLAVWGIARPRVLLPRIAREWPDARICFVLRHELAHVRRGDWLVQCAAELVRVVYWFHPLVWRACTRLRQESDHACDDLVLADGADGSEYASHLVDVARVLRQQHAWIPAPAIAQTTGFERRVQAMLNAHANRRPLSRPTFALTLAVSLAIALPLAALTAAQTLVSFTGAVVDPTNAVLPNAIVTLTNAETQAKYEVRTNREGRYEIPGLPSGRYVLQSSVPGFETITLNLTVGGENVHRDLKLDLGTIQETITVASEPSAPPRQLTPEQQARLEERLSKRGSTSCGEIPQASPAIGGNIRMPLKLRDKRPVFPAALAGSGVSGKVELQAIIATDGSVDRIELKSATHSEFADAAMEAVRQWEFEATLLNCAPVETRMNVTANFVQR